MTAGCANETMKQCVTPQPAGLGPPEVLENEEPRQRPRYWAHGSGDLCGQLVENNFLQGVWELVMHCL